MCWHEGTNFFVLCNVSSWICISPSTFLVIGLSWDTIDMYESLPSGKLLEIQMLAHAFLQRQPVIVCQTISFFGKGNLLYQWTYINLPVVLCHSECQVECLPSSSSFISFHHYFSVEHQHPVPLQFPFFWRGYHHRCFTKSLCLLFSGFWVSLTL